jgi:hypothetical protein
MVILAFTARTYLTSPPTNVLFDKVFSTAKNVITEHRTRLLPANAEDLNFNLPLLKDD